MTNDSFFHYNSHLNHNESTDSVSFKNFIKCTPKHQQTSQMVLQHNFFSMNIKLNAESYS